MERAMGIEPSSYLPDVIASTEDKYDDHPKPSKSQPSVSESRYQVWPFPGFWGG
jgi:hypothetical protein